MSEIFNGRSGEMRDSPWLASEDLIGLGEKTLTIKAVHRHKDVEFEAGRKKPVVYSVEFNSAKRQLVLNGTNRKAITRMYGPDVREWSGKPVTLYVQTGIKVGRETKAGIRIKDND